jgi:hypothetical protein
MVWVERVMRFTVLVLAIAVCGALAAPPDEKLSPRQEAQKKSAPKAKGHRAVQQSLTGCVDEQDGKYVLVDDRMLTKLANLEAATAGNEDVFAKHVGHKVTITGTKPSEPDGPFKVTRIEELSTVCAPAQGTNPQ